MNANAEFLQDWEAREAAQQQAARLYPHNTVLQTEWLRAVDVVRSTTRGWVLDMFVKRQQGVQS